MSIVAVCTFFKNKIKLRSVVGRMRPSMTFIDVFHDHRQENDGAIEKVYVADSTSGPWHVVDATEEVAILETLKLTHIHFYLSGTERPRQSQNAFEILMLQRKRTFPPRKDSGAERELNNKEKMYNALIDEMKSNGLDLPATVADSDGSLIVSTLRNALWYITLHHKVINNRAGQLPMVERVPEIWNKYEGWLDLEMRKRKKKDLSAHDLGFHVEKLMSILKKPIFGGRPNWKEFSSNILKLATCLASYQQYLLCANEAQQKRQMLEHPVREVSDCAIVKYIEGTTGEVNPVYQLLDKIMRDSEDGQPVFFNEAEHIKNTMDRKERWNFLENLRLSVSINMLKYSPGGSHIAVTIFARVNENRSKTEISQDAASLFASVQKDLPEYHTRRMKREFRERFGYLTKIPPHVQRALYHELTGDCSVDQNKEMDERIRMILDGQEGLIADLRSCNKGRPGDKYDQFFEILMEEVEKFTAADERRHGVAHLSHYLSIPEMIRRISSAHPDVAIPSPSLVRLQFMPRNENAHSAMTFTRRIPIQFKVQRRQLRAYHPDAHFCNAHFKYLKQMAVNLREECSFYCLDDKCKIPFGEPGTNMATGVRGKRSLVPSHSVLAAADHDQLSKGSLTPSVTLEIDVPVDLNHSFYQGQVYVSVNDSVFEASSPFNHAASLANLHIKDGRPIALIFTDGGPDHRLNFESVRLSLIAIFKKCDLDFLVAARCCPGQSYMNPVERIMSVLNLGLQNSALGREKGDTDFEEIIKKCHSMKEIREAATKHSNIDVQKCWAESIASMIKTVCDRFEFLTLKDKPIKTIDPINKKDVLALQDIIREKIDSSIDFKKTQKVHMAKCKEYQHWVNKHVRCRTYSYQIRKCDDLECCGPRRSQTSLQWLPDPQINEAGDHYLKFEEVVSLDTTDENRPSNQPYKGKVEEDVQGCSTSILVGQRAKSFVKCKECEKPRVVYCMEPKNISIKQLMDLDAVIDEYDYTCGSPLVPSSHPLYKKVFVRIGLTCGSHVEFAYYSGGVGDYSVCCFCGEVGGTRSQELVMQYKVVLPVCKSCTDLGKKSLTSHKRH